MFKKIIHFIKYNNLTVLIIAALFIFATGVFAQTETGQAVIGAKQTATTGIDNTLLLAADLENINMDYKIANITEDNLAYYVKYTFIDLVTVNNAWQYQLSEKIKKVSKKSRVDLGSYLAKELSEEYDAHLKELKAAQTQAQVIGEEKRTEVVAYSGLIGQTLDLASRLFPVYESVKKTELPSPELFIPRAADQSTIATDTDDLTEIYNQYLAEHLASSSPDNESASSSEPVIEERPPVETPAEPAVPTTEPVIEPEKVEVIELPPTETSQPNETLATPSE